MESNAGPRGLRPLLVLLGVLASVAVVAIASRGSVPIGEEGGRRPTETLADVLFTLYLFLLVAGAVFFVYLLALQRHLKSKTGIDSVSPLSRLVFFVILLVGLYLALRLNGSRRLEPPDEVLVPIGGAPPQGQPVPAEPTREPEFAWVTALVLVGLLVAGALAVWWAGLRRRRAYAPRELPALGEALAEVLEESIDELRAEQDPRRAVIRAYARLERVLAANGLPKRPSDAPVEYLRRVLRDLSVSPDSVQRLTLLFERARFSQHEVGTEMKDEAIAALLTLQDELRTAEALAQQERSRAGEPPEGARAAR